MILMFVYSQDSQGLILNRKKIRPEFALYYLASEVQKFKTNSRGSTIQGVTKSQLSSILIPLPSFDEQDKVINEINSEWNSINVNKDLIERFETKIAVRIKSVWEEK